MTPALGLPYPNILLTLVSFPNSSMACLSCLSVETTLSIPFFASASDMVAMYSDVCSGRRSSGSNAGTSVVLANVFVVVVRMEEEWVVVVATSCGTKP
mmetsp:Transcript_8169/g.15374  ORF Transcript_8169/g.15374 Transcript_8169/m.15374 type:complete len:98 (+) Transcript_8169:301-594(+)